MQIFLSYEKRDTPPGGWKPPLRSGGILAAELWIAPLSPSSSRKKMSGIFAARQPLPLNRCFGIGGHRMPDPGAPVQFLPHVIEERIGDRRHHQREEQAKCLA